MVAYNRQLWSSCTPEQRVVLEQYWTREKARVLRNRLVGAVCALAIVATFCAINWLNIPAEAAL